MCCQEIDGRAKKCPYCQHWQSTLPIFLYRPIAVAIPLTIFLLLFGVMMQKIFNQGEPYEPHKAELTIAHSEMKFGTTQCGPTVVILGTIANSGDYGWKDVNVEVRFKDKDGKMSDGGQDRQYSMVIPPHGDAVFKASMKQEFPADQYTDYTIEILSAKDRRAWP